jgi:hypothetical protein
VASERLQMGPKRGIVWGTAADSRYVAFFLAQEANRNEAYDAVSQQRARSARRSARESGTAQAPVQLQGELIRGLDSDPTS